MKVVVCKNCGANFQIDDNEDINTYECSICAGDLMYDDDYENIPSNSRTQRFNTDFLEKTYNMVQCEDCGLKYRLDKTDNINDYMCTSCGGRLQYIDKNMEPRNFKEETFSNQLENDIMEEPEDYDDGYIYVDHSNDEVYQNEDDAFYNGFVEDTYYTEDKDQINSNPSDDAIYTDYEENNDNLNLNNYTSYEDNVEHSKHPSLYPRQEESFEAEKLEVPDSLDYDELRGYLIGSFKENMDKRYKLYNLMKDRKDTYNSNNNLDTTENNYYNNINTSVNNSRNTAYKDRNSDIKSRRLNNSENKNNIFDGSYNVSKIVGDDLKLPKEEKSKKRLGFLDWGNSKFKDIRDRSHNNEDNNFKPQIDQHHSFINNPDYRQSDDSFFYSSDVLNPDRTLESLDNIKKQNLVPDPNETNEPYSYIYIGIGTLVMVLGFFDTIRSNRTYSLIFVFIGMGIFAVGLLKNRAFDEREKRGRIIRSKLLTLPENFYVLYYVKVPESNEGINHVVVGPTGIYTIVSQKYDAKEDKDRIKQENETKELISLLGEDSDKRLIPDENPITSKFINPNQKVRFEHNNRIKQKVLRLSYELEDFLKENNLECPIESYVGFVNQDVAVLNSPLNDEDYFIDELLNKIVNSPVKINLNTVHKCAILLTQYSTKCSN